MKYLKVIVILMLLVGLPLGSWLFLKSGLDWRKGKVTELKAKDQFFSAFEFSKADKDKLYEIMAHRTCVVKLNEPVGAEDEELIDQFKDAYTFKFVSFERTDAQAQSWSSKSAVRYYKPESQAPRYNRIADVDYVLVDTTGFVRNYYEGTGKRILNAIVEDVAVILPRKKPKDIGIRDKK